ncbi:MAG: hypothetical protein L3J08_06575 [Flavobacteriaceae bacterium]|nr:hypothetical protein [Flavobacteriaceae bacterium]
MKKIKLTRESVAMADDISSPHFMEIEIQQEWTITEILKFIIDSGYLPKISGGEATWSVAIDEPIAVFTQNDSNAPMLICLPDYPHYGTMNFVKIEQVHFNYHAQKSTKEVFDVLSRFNLKPYK